MKFKVGDKVRFVKNRPCCAHNRNYLLGQIFTIEKPGPYHFTWKMKENDRYFFDEKELELVENTKVDITIDVTDKAGAHKAVEDAIAEYKKKKAEWTEDELAQARELFKELIAEWCLDNHKGYCFLVNTDKTRCSLYANLKVMTPQKNIVYEQVAEAKIFDNDVFDETIGKVVLLCKALKKPIPDFIKTKNR